MDSSTYHEGVQDAYRYPEATPQGIDDRDQRVARLETIDTGYELRQTSEDSHEGKEDRG